MVFGTISYFRPTGTLEMPFGTPEIPWPPPVAGVFLVCTWCCQMGTRGGGPFCGLRYVKGTTTHEPKCPHWGWGGAGTPLWYPPRRYHSPLVLSIGPMK